MARRFFYNLAAVGCIFLAATGLISQEALWRRLTAIVVFLIMAAVFLAPPPLEKGGE